MPPPSPSPSPPPPSVAWQVAEIAADPDRASAYARLLHLQRGCADDPAAAADLAAESPSALLPLLVRDVADHDEAVAASALKCLGFALYHPVLLSTISVPMAKLALDALVLLIVNTRMKCACNLGVWCISVQQLEPLIIEDRADPVLAAIVHALDNPLGSLSTTFEAAQAIMRLADQIPKRMRELSSLWVPPICRRLLSSDKTERDMSERCLIKVSRVILPPQPLLSKAVASDLEQELLSGMMNMLGDPLKKVQAMKSWGWIVSLLGSSVVHNRPLLNKLLKIPEQMFIDCDPQVQVATMVSWRNLVDALLPSHPTESMAQEAVVCPFEPGNHTSALVKRIRLIMMPLNRVLSGSHNIVLCSSCLSTWHYLLHKLGNLINHLSILEIVFGPVLKIVFSFGINDQNKPLWSFCMNLFLDFISSKNRCSDKMRTPVNRNLHFQSCMHFKALWDAQPIKWLPWDISCFNFQLEILGTILNPELFQGMTHELVVLVMDSARQIFRFLLEEIVQVVVDELDHSLLASEKFEICLDIKHINENQYTECSPKVPYPGISPLSCTAMVSPAVYMSALSLSMVAQFAGELSHGDADKLALIISSSDIMKNFHFAVYFMYVHIRRPMLNRPKIKWLMIWNKLAKILDRQIICYLKIDSGSSSWDVLYQFFCYPFFALLCPGETLVYLNAENRSDTCAPLAQDLDMELALEVYRSLSTSSVCGSKTASKIFLHGFHEYLVSVIDENMSLFQANLEYCSEKFQNTTILSALGEVVIGILQNDQILKHCNKVWSETDEDSAGCRQPNLFLSCLKMVNRFMRLSSFCFKSNPTGQHQVTNRFFSSLSTFVGHLVLKDDVLLLFKIVGDQLTEWLSLSGMFYCELQPGETIEELEKLWLKIVECLKMNQVISDGAFVAHQELLQVALKHPHHPISVATASVWGAATCGKQTLRHSACLVSQLDELLTDRRKVHFNSSSDADKAFAHEEIDIARKFALPMPEDAGSLKISVGLGRKRLKMMKYSAKPKELQNNSVHNSSLITRIKATASVLRCMESKVCRKPELILEMLQRKR
ncbi:hypothetical protein ACP4OV_006599 [Aristida adscensionis]